MFYKIKSIFARIIYGKKRGDMSLDNRVYDQLYYYFNNNYISVDEEPNNYHSPVKLMKLFVLSHIVYYRLYKQPLLEQLELWVLGPVSNRMYAKMNDVTEYNKSYENWDHNVEIEYDEKVLSVMEAINNFYGKMSGETLVRLLHNDSLWEEDFPKEARVEDIQLQKEINVSEQFLHIPLDNEKLNQDYRDIGDPNYPNFIDYCNRFQQDKTYVFKLGNKKHTFFCLSDISYDQLEEFVKERQEELINYINESGSCYTFIDEENGELYVA